MSLLDDFVDVTRQEGARITLPKSDPRATHFVEMERYQGQRTRIGLAECGVFIAVADRSYNPTCVECARILREQTADEECPY